MQKEFKKRFWRYFKWVTLTLFVAASFLVFVSNKTYGINKTVGWSWTFANPQFWLILIMFLIALFITISFLTLVIMKVIQCISN